MATSTYASKWHFPGTPILTGERFLFFSLPVVDCAFIYVRLLAWIGWLARVWFTRIFGNFRLYSLHHHQHHISSLICHSPNWQCHNSFLTLFPSFFRSFVLFVAFVPFDGNSIPYSLTIWLCVCAQKYKLYNETHTHTHLHTFPLQDKTRRRKSRTGRRERERERVVRARRAASLESVNFAFA